MNLNHPTIQSVPTEPKTFRLKLDKLTSINLALFYGDGKYYVQIRMYNGGMEKHLIDVNLGESYAKLSNLGKSFMKPDHPDTVNQLWYVKARDFTQKASLEGGLANRLLAANDISNFDTSCFILYNKKDSQPVEKVGILAINDEVYNVSFTDSRTDQEKQDGKNNIYRGPPKDRKLFQYLGEHTEYLTDTPNKAITTSVNTNAIVTNPSPPSANPIEIYVNGVNLPQDGNKGGWAARIKSNCQSGMNIDQLKGNGKKVSAGAMRITGVIEALKLLPSTRCNVKIMSDLNLVNGANGTYRNTKNLPLWQKLHKLAAKHDIEWVPVKRGDKEFIRLAKQSRLQAMGV